MAAAIHKIVSQMKVWEKNTYNPLLESIKHNNNNIYIPIATAGLVEYIFKLCEEATRLAAPTRRRSSIEELKYVT